MAKPKSSPEARLAAAEANSYKRGAHTANDKKKDLKKYDERVLEEQSSTLDIYVT